MKQHSSFSDSFTVSQERHQPGFFMVCFFTFLVENTKEGLFFVALRDRR
jgi:hypothetical protein